MVLRRVTRTASRARAPSGLTRMGLRSRHSIVSALVAARRDSQERAAVRASRLTGGLAPEARQERPAGDRLDHGLRLGLVSGGGVEGHVLEGLDEDAAEPENDDRPEHGVALYAENGLHAFRHDGSDEAAVDCRVREDGAAGGNDLVGRSLGGGAIGDAEADAPDVVLVHDVQRQHLEDERKTQFRGSVVDFAGGSRQAGGDHRYRSRGDHTESGDLVERTGWQFFGGRDVRPRPPLPEGARVACVPSP